ncbi:MAG: AAA family ATPase [Marinobacter sp.]|uniref:AAA family ATPase n=1 Tax=Marinobacter sp. TaxID=50741 RepID=UPI00329982AD
MSINDDSRFDKLKAAISKMYKVVKRGFSVMDQMPELVKDAQKDKYDPEWVETSEVDSRIQQRRYGTTQAAEMVGISVGTLYAAEQDGRLPPPEYRTDTAKKVRAGYTVNHINHMQRVLGTSPSKPENLPAAICGVLNLKGGSHKTTTCHLFSQYLAMRGYKCLVLDTDPQGSLSFYFGKRPDYDIKYENTFAPFILEDDAALREVGHPRGSSKNLRYAIQKTYWDNIDIIPSCLENLAIDLLLPQLMEASRKPKIEFIAKLREGLREVGKDYDFIIIDGTPSLNMTTLNVVSACDVVFVPTPAALLDFASTLQFSKLISDTARSYIDMGVAPHLPDLRYFITKFSGSSYAQFFGQIIRKVFTVERGDVLTAEAHASDEIGKANASTYSIYEKNPSDADNRKKLKSTIEMYDRLFAEMHDALTETVFGDAMRGSHLDKIDEIVAKAGEARKEIRDAGHAE